MLNKRSFLYQAGLLASSNMLLLLLNFIYRIILGGVCGPEGLGVYTLTMQVYGIVMSICVSGMTVAVTNLSASLLQNNDIRSIRKMMRFALLCFAMLLAGLSLPMLAFRETIATNLLGDARTEKALGMVLLCIALTGVENIIKALFNGTAFVKFSALSEVGEQTLRILFAAFLLVKYMNGDHGYSAFLILVGMTFSEVYSVTLLGINYIRKFGCIKSGGKKTLDIRRRFLKVYIPSAGTAILANVFASVATIIFPRRLLLAGYTHVEALSALGLLSGMVMPILMLPSALINALCTLLMPTISASFARSDSKDLQRKVSKGIEAAGLLGMPSTAMLMPFVPLLCLVLFGQTAPIAVVALLSAEVAVTYHLILSVAVLNGLGRQKQVLLFAAVSEIIQLGLVWVLSAKPSLHVYGYLTGMLLGDVLRVALGFVCVRKYTNTRIRFFHAVCVPIACSVIMHFGARLSFFYLVAGGCAMVVALLLSFIVCAAVYLLLLRLMGVDIFAYIRRTFYGRDFHKTLPTI
ncbi:MAG: oligosaccharide flippase family protein [Clostridiales bacterium]|nr:oligosaccharide flippase family protein [Clostridiales bacterium]